jgi:uncharacterized DUF497 family protein
MGFGVAGFDWDDWTREKCRKHGVSLAEIEEILTGDPHIAPDVAHSHVEDRFIAVGRTRANRPVFVAFTFRMKHGRMFMRPVSARYMHRKEIEHYEKESPPPED